MAGIQLPKLNYDDFYKFVTSFTVIGFLVGIIGATWSIIELFGTAPLAVFYFTVGFYFVLGMVSVAYFLWAIRRWKKNQEKLDSKLDAETAISILRVKKEAVEYEKQINDLAQDEPPFPQFDLFNSNQRIRAEKRVESRLKN